MRPTWSCHEREPRPSQEHTGVPAGARFYPSEVANAGVTAELGLADPYGADVDAPVDLLDHDVLTEGGGVDHQAVAQVEADVADVGVEEHQVTGLELVARDVRALGPLVTGVVVQLDALLLVGP